MTAICTAPWQADISAADLAKQERSERAMRNGLAGRSAEETVARHYQLKGHALLAERWRGSRGEIDLVLADGDGVIFVEVKKSHSHASARIRLSLSQMKRIIGAGYEFIAGQPRGLLTDVRLDVATVDRFGSVEVIENAFQEV